MSEPESAGPSKDDLKHAYKAFKKRLKMTRLDAESGLSRSPVTSGKQSEIVAIMPPQQFSQAVWDELVKQGRLKRAGHGTYELVEE